MISSKKFVPCEQKNSRIKILDYKSKDYSGILENPFYGKPQYFENVMQMIFLLENLFNENDFPQSDVDYRTFNKSRSFEEILSNEIPADVLKQLPIATFDLNVIFRRNASWQGILLWKDKMLEATFRSLLELLVLMESVLSETKTGNM